MKGKFITLEGAEGSGKSTQSKKIKAYLDEQGCDVFLLREPGGVKISESIRNVLLDVNNTEMGSQCETLLYMSARAQLVEEVIKPKLAEGKVILCDRFLDSTFVYQGYGIGVDVDVIKHIGQFATQGINPDLTLLFDIDVEVGLSRTDDQKDRIEQRSVDYHNRVRQGYLELAQYEPERIKVIEVNDQADVIFERVKTHLDEVLGLSKKT